MAKRKPLPTAAETALRHAHLRDIRITKTWARCARMGCTPAETLQIVDRLRSPDYWQDQLVIGVWISLRKSGFSASACAIMEARRAGGMSKIEARDLLAALPRNSKGLP